MTVADLIEDLKKMPQRLPVRVVLSEVYIKDESGETMMPLCINDASEAAYVRHEGSFILIQGK